MKKRNLIKIIAAALLVATLAVTLAVIPTFAESEYVTYRKGDKNVSDYYKASKYYTQLTNVPLTGDGATDVIAVALSQLGYQEGNSQSGFSGTTAGTGNYTEYCWNLGNNGSAYYWCAAFVSFCLYQGRATDHATSDEMCRNRLGEWSTYFWKEISCTTWTNALMTAGHFKWSQNLAASKGQEVYTPKPGDLIFYTWAGTSTDGSDHIGVVAYVDDGYVYTVEGNTSSGSGLEDNGGGCYFKKYALNSVYIYGYGAMPYEINTDAKIDFSGNNPTTGTYVNAHTKGRYLWSDEACSGTYIATIPAYAQLHVTDVVSVAPETGILSLLKVDYTDEDGVTHSGYIKDDKTMRIVQISNNHEHKYEEQVESEGFKVAALSCTAKNVYYKSCACGKAGEETFEVLTGAAHTHDKTVQDGKFLAVTGDCKTPNTYYKSCACGDIGAETFSGAVNPDIHAGTETEFVTNGDNTHSEKLLCCGAVVSTSSCSGGSATCTTKALCEHCGAAYSKLIAYRSGANGVSSYYKNSKFYTRLTSLPKTGDDRTDVLAVAISQLGYVEGDAESGLGGTAGGTGNFTEFCYNMGKVGSSYGYSWGTAFVSFCLYQAGATDHNGQDDWARNHAGDPDYIWCEVGCGAWIDNLKEGNNFKDSAAKGGSYVPMPADIVFFGKTSADRSGLVLCVDGNNIYTIEGNTNTNMASTVAGQKEGCYLKCYSLDSADIFGYGALPYKNVNKSKQLDYSGRNPIPGEYINAHHKARLIYSTDTCTGTYSATLPAYTQFEVLDVVSTYENSTVISILKVDYNGTVGYIKDEGDMRLLPYATEHVFDKELTEAEFKISDATCVSRALYHTSCVCGLTGYATFESGEINPDAHVSSEIEYASNNDNTHTARHACCLVAIGSAEACSGGSATCIEKAKCDLCNTAYGAFNSANHASDATEYRANNNGTHAESRVCCHQVIGESVPCSGGSATCIAYAVCDGCHAEYGEFAPHAYSVVNHDATYHWNSCVNCRLDSAKMEKNGRAATCTTKEYCGVCEAEFGEPLGHDHSVKTAADAAHWFKCSRCDDRIADAETQHTVKNPDESCVTAEMCECGYVYTEAKTAHKIVIIRFNDKDTHVEGCENPGCKHEALVSHTFDLMEQKAICKKVDASCGAKTTYYKSCLCTYHGEETFEVAENGKHSFGEFGEYVDLGNGTKVKKAYCTCGKFISVMMPSDAVDGGNNSLIAESNAQGAGLSMKIEQDESKISEEEKGKIADASGNKKLSFLDITIQNTDTNQLVSQTGSVLEIVLSYKLENKKNIEVYRNHNGEVASLAALESKEGELADGTYYLDTEANLIYIYTNQFSTYAVAYNDAGSSFWTVFLIVLGSVTFAVGVAAVVFIVLKKKKMIF